MSPEQLIYLLRSKVIPWALPGARSNIFVAQEKMCSLVLPEGVTASRRKLAGRRVVVKDQRKFGNRRLIVAEWPEDNLQEIAEPKLVCITSGIADYLLGNYCAHCQPGTFFFVPPLVPHQQLAPNLQGERRRNGSCSLLHAYAYQSGVHFWYSRSENERHINDFHDNYLIPSLSASQILSLMAEEAVEGNRQFEAIAAGLTYAFFTIIAREIENGNFMHPGPRETLLPTASTASFAEEVQEYLETHCHYPLRLEGVAAHMYMSRSQFIRRMKQEVGMTFGESLTRIRMERACKMLSETEFTVNAIAGWLSFRSATHFQSLFHSRIGCTPTEYRRKMSLKN